MNTVYIITAIGIVILLILGIWFMIRKIKQNRVNKLVPEDVIKDFDRVQEIYKEGNGRITQQEALLRLYQEKSNNMNNLVKEYNKYNTNNISNEYKPSIITNYVDDLKNTEEKNKKKNNPFKIFKMKGGKQW